MKYKVNISIDDVSPHPLSSVGVLNRCHELISKLTLDKLEIISQNFSS